MMELLWVTEEINKNSVAKKDSPAVKHIRRPENAFMIFRKRKVRPFHKELHASEISRLAKEQWWQLTDEEHKYYARESEIEKLKHSVSYPNWKYAPKPSRKKKSPKGKRLQTTPAPDKSPLSINQIDATPINQLGSTTSDTSLNTSFQGSVASNQHVQHFDDLSNSTSLLDNNSNLNPRAFHPNDAHPSFSHVPTESSISNLSLAPTAVFNEYHMDCGNLSVEELFAKEFSIDNLNDLLLFNNKAP
ncbi:hypothetical protein V8B55DRAFT_1569774 [Mucor lusitanicus]